VCRGGEALELDCSLIGSHFMDIYIVSLSGTNGDIDRKRNKVFCLVQLITLNTFSSNPTHLHTLSAILKMNSGTNSTAILENLSSKLFRFNASKVRHLNV
jgi:hypothetical protein